MYLLILAILIILIIVFMCKDKIGCKEYYGGPVKNIRRIPRTTCYGNCDQYYQQCMAQFKNVDAGLCSNRYWNCISTCNYTDYHRM